MANKKVISLKISEDLYEWYKLIGAKEVKRILERNRRGVTVSYRKEIKSILCPDKAEYVALTQCKDCFKFMTCKSFEALTQRTL